MDKLHNPLVAACKVVAAGNRIVLQPEDRGRSFIEDVRSKRRKRIFDRNGVYVLPCWVVTGNSQERLAQKRLELLDKSCPNDRQVYPQAQSLVPKQALMNSILSELMNSILSELTNTVRNRC